MIGQASAEGWVEHAPSILNSAIALSPFMEPDSDPVGSTIIGGREIKLIAL